MPYFTVVTFDNEINDTYNKLLLRQIRQGLIGEATITDCVNNPIPAYYDNRGKPNFTYRRIITWKI